MEDADPSRVSEAHREFWEHPFVRLRRMRVRTSASIFSLPRHQLVTPIVQLYPRYESGLPPFSYISWRGNKANAYPLSTKNSRCEVQTLCFLFFRMEQAVFEVGTGPVPQ